MTIIEIETTLINWKQSLQKDIIKEQRWKKKKTKIISAKKFTFLYAYC